MNKIKYFCCNFMFLFKEFYLKNWKKVVVGREGDYPPYEK